MPYRSRLIIPIAIAVVALILGVVAAQSHSSDTSLSSRTNANCPPIARPDVAATTPTDPVSVDVLANDTDPNGDPLVFKVLSVDGGQASVDNGGTPTDKSDDKVLFTPAAPAPPAATVKYRAVDPSGASSDSTLTVTINETATLPDGVASADPASDTTIPDGPVQCSKDGEANTPTSASRESGPTVTSDTLAGDPGPFVGGVSPTTGGSHNAKSKAKSSTTTTPGTKPTATTATTAGSNSSTTSRPNTTTTTRPRTTTTVDNSGGDTTPSTYGPGPCAGLTDQQCADKYRHTTSTT